MLKGLEREGVLPQSPPRTLEGCYGEEGLKKDPIRFSFHHFPDEKLSPAEVQLKEGLGKAVNLSPYAKLVESPRPSDVIFAFHHLQPGPAPLIKRIVETEETLAQKIGRQLTPKRLPGNLIALIPLEHFNDFSRLPYQERVGIMRTAMARIGSFKVLFLGDKGKYALGTLEGGCPIIDGIDDLCDRLIFMAAAKPVERIVPEKGVADWEIWGNWGNYPTVQAIIEAGRKLGRLKHLSPPFDVVSVASEKRARLIKRLIGWLRQSEGAFFAWAPEIEVPSEYQLEGLTGLPMVSGTGREEIDKTNLKPGDLSLLTLKDGQMVALGKKGPSVEAGEFFQPVIDENIVPRVCLSPHPDGFIFDPQGPFVVPFIRAIFHSHRAVEEIKEPNLIEHLRPNFGLFPYAVGCGVDIMEAVSTEAVKRSKVIQAPGRPEICVIADILNHGTNIILPWAAYPDTEIIPVDPFANLFFLLNSGALNLTPEVPQI